MSAHRDHVEVARRGRSGWRGAVIALAGCLAAGYLSTCFHSVRTGEQAIVRRFGRALRRVRRPGLHVCLPYGLDRVDRLKVLETKRVAVGMGLADRELGRAGRGREVECLTGDTNLIGVSAIVQYRVRDAKAYSFAVADVAALVRAVAASELSRLISGMKVDDVLTVRRLAIQTQARDATQAALDRFGAGVRVTSVLLPSGGVAPPPEVAEAFRDVTAAREDRRRAVNVAEGYANRLAPEARGEAHRTLAEADGYAQQVVQEATGRADAFVKEAAEFKANRRVTTKRLILETMEDVLPRLRKVVLDGRAGGAVDLGLIEAKE